MISIISARRTSQGVGSQLKKKIREKNENEGNKMGK